MISSNENIPNYPNLEIIQLIANTKNEISQGLSQKEKDDKLSELEKKITGLFPKDSLFLEEGHSFENFAKKVIKLNPELKSHFSELFLHFKSDDKIIKPSNTNWEQQLKTFLKEIPKTPENGKMFLEEVTKNATALDDKKLAYKLFVAAFEINTVDKFLAFNHSDELFAIEAALFAIAPNKGNVSQNIEKYDIKDSQALIGIAKREALFNPLSFAEHIPKYDIKDEKIRIELAKTTAKNDDHAVSRYIQNFKIENEEARIEIARMVGAQKEEIISLYIDNYEIKDSLALLGLARLEARLSPKSFSENIQKYDIKNEKTRIEFAKTVAKYDGPAISRHIQNFKIEDEQARIEIFKIAATQNREIVSLYIDNYEIKDSQFLISIAKKEAILNPISFSLNIQKYGIKDEKTRIELAKIVAAQNGEILSLHIENYEITDNQALSEIFLIANLQAKGKAHLLGKQFSENLEKAFSVLRTYQKTDFENVEASFSALLSEKEWPMPKEIMNKIKNEINPETKKDLCLGFACFLGHADINKISSEQFKFLTDHGFVDSILAYQDPEVQNQLMSHSIAIAKDETKREYIDNLLKLQSPPHTKISMLLLSKLHAEGVSQEVCGAQFKIASHAMFNEGKNLRAYISTLHIISESNLKKEDKEQLLKLISIENILPISRSIQTLKSLDKISELNKENLEKFTMSQILETHLQGVIFDRIKNKENLEISKKSNPAFVSFLEYSESKKVSAKQLAFVIENGLLDNIFEYRDPQMRYPLMSSLIALVTDQTGVDYVNDLLKTKYPPHAKIPMLLISKLHAEGVSKEACDAQFKIASHVIFKDGKNLRLYVNTLNIISKSNLNKEEKEYLLQLINATPPKNVIPILRTFQTLGNISKLSEVNKENLEKFNMAKILENNVKELIPATNVDNFNDKFEKYFGNSRIPNFIFTYAAKLHEDESLKKCLGVIVDTILTGDFNEMRYDLTKSEHLTKVFSENKNLLDKWKIGAERDLKDFLPETDSKTKYDKYTIVDTDNYEDLFLLGTEAGGTCQSIDDRRLEYNRCLMGYVLDGKNRLLAVKDENGRIIARHVFRVLLDGDKPVLFMETLYPKVVDENLKQALQAFAKTRAKDLDLPLLTNILEEGSIKLKPYGSSIVSLSTINPIRFEYVDAVKTGITHGQFEIASPNVV